MHDFCLIIASRPVNYSFSHLLSPLGGVGLLTSDSDERRCNPMGAEHLTGEVLLRMICDWREGDDGRADSSGTGELQGKLKAVWLLERLGGAEGGGETEGVRLPGVLGGVMVRWWNDRVKW